MAPFVNSNAQRGFRTEEPVHYEAVLTSLRR